MKIENKAIRNFSKKVRELREAKGWSQDVLADELGVDRSYVSSLERGLRNPTLKTMSRIAQILRVDIEFDGTILG